MIKRVRSKVRIHPVFWVVFGAGIITGHFWEVAAVFFIVIVHECGHAVAAALLGWRITSIELLPFGGVAKVDEHGNRPFKEEFIVTLAGPVQHLWLPAVSTLMLMTPFWNEANHQLFLERNWMILCFNLLPIWPLDGGKLLSFWLAKRYPYKKAFQLSLIFSAVFLMGMTLWMLTRVPPSLNYIVIAVFLTVTLIKEWKQWHYVFLRFLLERWRESGIDAVTQTIIVPPEMPINRVLEKFYKDVGHRIVVRSPEKRTAIQEHDLLDAYFSGQFTGRSVGDVVH